MASTERAATPVNIVGNAMQAEGNGGEFKFKFGLVALGGSANGTVELDTGLSSVWGFLACNCSGADTESVCPTILEDLPTTTGTITIDGTKLDEGQAVANATTQTLCWLAWGQE